MRPVVIAVALSSTLASPALAQHLLVTDKTNDRVMLLDARNGRIVNPDFIAPPAGTLVAPVKAIQVGDQVWVTEPGLDAVRRFSIATGALVSTLQGPFAIPLDRPSGIATDGSVVHVTCTFLAKHLSGSWITRISTSGANLGTFDAFNDDSIGDVFFHDDAFWVGNKSDRSIARVTPAGANLGVFASLDQDAVFTSPEQIAARADGSILVASHQGLVHLDPSGVLIERILPDSFFDGVAELDDGRLLLTNSFGVHRLEPNGQLVTLMDGVISGYASLVSGATACAADFAPPIGSVDFSDVTAFLAAFAAESPEADLAPPFTVIDFSDVVAFLQDFAAGCP